MADAINTTHVQNRTRIAASSPHLNFQTPKGARTSLENRKPRKAPALRTPISSSIASGLSLVAQESSIHTPEQGGVPYESCACYCVVVSCVSMLLFIVLVAALSISRACAIAGAVVLLLGLVGWIAPTGNGAGGPAAQQQLPAATAPGVRLVVHHQCACGLPDDAIAALPTFAYEPPVGMNGDGADDEKVKPCGSSVLCAVCLEDVRAGEMVRQLPACHHLFHVDCVDAWLRAHRTCPLCRCQLSPGNVSTKAPAVAEESWVDALPPV